MTAMDITIHSTFLPHDDPDASLAFYRDRSSGAVPPKLCQRPREISGSFSAHLPTRRYCIAAPNLL